MSVEKRTILDMIVLKNAVRRVRELHEQFDEPKWESTWCKGCSSPDDDWFVAYPCDTIKALNGDR